MSVSTYERHLFRWNSWKNGRRLVRWKAEIAMSLVKRRCGKAPIARIEIIQGVQPLLRGVADNRLVRLGSSP